MPLADRWEELVQEHRLVETVGYETGETLWVHYSSNCSCSYQYPIIPVTLEEARIHQRYVAKYRETHSHAEHLKHLVHLLLDEDWLRIDEVDRDYIPIEQA